MGDPSSPHPTDQALRSYGLGRLDGASWDEVERHLAACAPCRDRVAALTDDAFLARVRAAREGGGPTATDTLRGAPTVAEPPPEGMRPPRLADHPDYEIRRELGRGGMGVVYLAHNKLMGRDEVLKVMGRHLMDRPGVLDRFLREIRAVARLRHPNIVTAYSAVRIGESIVLAMEYVEGLDLSKMVRIKGPLPVAHACNFIHQAALGLQHAHEEGLVHRDIKPGNLMLSRKGDKPIVKVLDFGLARATREERVDGSLTREGQALGTPDYIAPEQILDATTVDIRADIYSLGGTLYYLLTGRPPFSAASLFDVYQAHVSREPDPLNFVRPEVPAELAALAAKLMAKDPARRFQTPGEVAEALKPFFRNAKAAFRGPEVDVSHAGRESEVRTAAREVSAPIRQAAEPEAALVPAEGPAAPTVPEGRWESLIDFRDRGSSVEGASVVRLTERPSSPPRGKAIAAALSGLAAIGIMVVLIRNRGGEPRAATPARTADQVRPPKAPAPGPPKGIPAADESEKVSAAEPAEPSGDSPPAAPDAPALAESDAPAQAPPAASAAPAAPLPEPAAKSASAPRPASPAGPRPYSDEFNDGQVVLPGDPGIPPSPTHGRSTGGTFFVFSGGFHAWNIHDIKSESLCEVVGRVLGTSPRGSGCWAAIVHSRATPPRGFMVKINVKGELFLEPSPWRAAAQFRQVDPRLGPITHPAIRPGFEFNKIDLLIKNRELTILVNGVQVCGPVRLDYDLLPARLQFGATGPGKKRAEFDRVEIRGLGDPGRVRPEAR